MKKSPFSKLLLGFLFLAVSCKAQVASKNSLTKGKTKMVRTQGVTAGSVTSGVQDESGNLWISTAGEGIYRYDGEVFTQFTTKNGLCDNDITEMIRSRDGDFLLATASGVYRFDPVSVQCTLLTRHDMNKVCSIFEDNEGNVWFGTVNNGLYCYNGKTFSSFLNTDTARQHPQLILDILQDKKGKLWFSSFSGGGAWNYDPQTKSMLHYIPPREYYRSNEDKRSPLDPQQNILNILVPQVSAVRDSITDDMIFSMTEDSKGNLWFATRRHGACKFDGRLFTSFGQKDGFAEYGVFVIKEDKNGNLWFGTDKNGVYCYDGKTFRNFTTLDGLVNNSVLSILEDKNGNLWFGTRNFGLSRYDGKTFVTLSE